MSKYNLIAVSVDVIEIPVDFRDIHRRKKNLPPCSENKIKIQASTMWGEKEYPMHTEDSATALPAPKGSAYKKMHDP